MFRDTDGNTMTYIPITGLIEGELSQVFNTVHDTPRDGELTGTLDVRANIWARVAGVGSYQNVSVNGMDLSGLGGPETEFEFYVEALSPIVGFQRVPMKLSASESSPAGWTT